MKENINLKTPGSNRLGNNWEKKTSNLLPNILMHTLISPRIEVNRLLPPHPPLCVPSECPVFTLFFVLPEGGLTDPSDSLTHSLTHYSHSPRVASRTPGLSLAPLSRPPGLPPRTGRVGPSSCEA